MNILAKIVSAVNPALEKFKSGVKNHQKDIFLGFCIILISVISFNLGKINALQKTPIKITGEGGEANVYKTTGIKTNLGSDEQKPLIEQPHQDLRVVVSKASSSKKYHFVWCPGAQRITAKNLMYFNSAIEAEKAGYTLAGNCHL